MFETTSQTFGEGFLSTFTTHCSWPSTCPMGPRAAHGAPEGAVDSPPTGDEWNSHGKMMGKMMEK